MSDKHEKALDLTEQALDALVKGDETGADKLLDKARALDATAVEEVVADLDEDAAAQQDAAAEDGEEGERTVP